MPSPAPARATPKARGSNKKLTVILRLPPSVLTQFPAIGTPSRKAPRTKPSAASFITAIDKPAELDSHESHSERVEVTPLKQENEGDDQISAITGKRKGVPGPKPGTKRSASTVGDIDGMPKARGKPGPKKKARLEGDLLPTGVRGSLGGSTPISTHKLGPKANQGAINAGLRALDRTGKPCRRWTRKAFELKSFTGIAWGLPSWRTLAIATIGFGGDVKGDNSGSTDAKGEPPSSAVQSEKSTSGVEVERMLPVTSLPAPVLLSEALMSA